MNTGVAYHYLKHIGRENAALALNKRNLLGINFCGASLLHPRRRRLEQRLRRSLPFLTAGFLLERRPQNAALVLRLATQVQCTGKCNPDEARFQLPAHASKQSRLVISSEETGAVIISDGLFSSFVLSPEDPSCTFILEGKRFRNSPSFMGCSYTVCSFERDEKLLCRGA